MREVVYSLFAKKPPFLIFHILSSVSQWRYHPFPCFLHLTGSTRFPKNLGICWMHICFERRTEDSCRLPVFGNYLDISIVQGFILNINYL